jgi:CHASE3 domain sensor protein
VEILAFLGGAIGLVDKFIVTPHEQADLDLKNKAIDAQLTISQRQLELEQLKARQAQLAAIQRDASGTQMLIGLGVLVVGGLGVAYILKGGN